MCNSFVLNNALASRPRLTLDWSVLEASLVDAWTSERSVQNPQELDFGELDAC